MIQTKLIKSGIVRASQVNSETGGFEQERFVNLIIKRGLEIDSEVMKSVSYVIKGGNLIIKKAGDLSIPLKLAERLGKEISDIARTYCKR